MRRIPLIILTVSLSLTLPTGVVMGFGSARVIPAQVQTGDAAITVSHYAPVQVGGVAVDLIDDGQPRVAAEGMVTNTGAGPGQPELVSGLVRNITATGPYTASNGDTDACNTFIRGGGVTGAVSFPEPGVASATTALLPPPSGGAGGHATFDVVLTMGTNPLATAGASVCSNQTLGFDVVMTSSLPS